MESTTSVCYVSGIVLGTELTHRVLFLEDSPTSRLDDYHLKNNHIRMLIIMMECSRCWSCLGEKPSIYLGQWEVRVEVASSGSRDRPSIPTV